MKRALPFNACLAMVLFAFLNATAGIAPDGLAAAVAASNDYDVIELDPDTTYTLTAELLVGKAITIRGAGIGSTIIKQTGSNQRVLILSNGLARVEHCTITGGKLVTERGRLEGYGGCGVLIHAVGGTLSHCRVTGNSSTCNHNRGLGVDMRGTNGVLSHCIVDNNVITGGTNGSYAGIYMCGGVMEFCLVYANKGHNAGGIYLDSSTAVISNCTVTANIENNDVNGAGGIKLNSGSGSRIENCVFAGNITPATDTSLGRPEWGRADGSAVFVNSSFPSSVGTNQYVGGNCILADTLYVDAANNDYRQRLASPTRDLGYYVPYDYATFACDCTVTTNELFVGGTTSFRSYVTGYAVGDTLAYAWTVTRPDATTTNLSGATPELACDQVGHYSVQLVVTKNGATPVTNSLASCVLAAPVSVNVATTAELLAALSVAICGTEINLAEATFEITDQLTLGKGMALKGAGIDKTIIKQTVSKKRCLYLNHPDDLVEGLTVRGGNSGGTEGIHGLGVYIMTLGGTLRNCRITGNTLQNNWTFGIGVAMVGPGLVDHCIIDGNVRTGGTSGDYGGGIYASAGIVDECLVYGNGPAQYGGGIYAAGAVQVRNCTFVKNSSYSTAGGVYFTSAAAKFVNCIFALNTSSASDTTVGVPEWSGSTVKPTFTACSFPTAVATNAYIGGDCLLIDPVFKDADNNDFHPLSSSQTKDAGVDYEGLAAFDLDGSNRVSGASVDIGCYEFDSSAFTVAFEGPATGNGFVGDAAVFTASVSGLEEGAEVSYAWIFTNRLGGTTAKTGAVVEFTPTVAGDYSVSVTASVSGDGSVSFSETDCFYACPRNLYVKEPGPANDAAAAFPYDGWACASTNLHETVAMAIEGTKIWLDAGTFPVTSRLDITRALTLTGKGIDQTVVRARHTRASLLYVNDPGACVSRMTLSGFRSDVEVIYRGAVIIDSRGGTIEECRLTDNRFTSASINHARGVGVTLNGAAARVNRCIIDRNAGSMSQYSDIGGGVYGIAGVIENSLICCNTNYAGGGIAVDGTFTIRNCTVAANLAQASVTTSLHNSYGGGGIFVVSGTANVQNTIFFGNACGIATEGLEYLAEWRALGTLNLVNCSMTPLIALPAGATDCVTEDPLFKDAAAGDYRLASTSPCRDVGLYAAWMADALDLDGKPRVDRRTFVDIGCFENQASRATLLLVR